MTRSTSSKYTPIQLAFLIAAGCTIAVVCVFNWQPWIVVGQDLASYINVIPGASLLTRIWFIGGWFSMLFGALGVVIGLVLWAWVQIVQISPIFLSAFPRATPEWLADMRKYALVAYLIEGAAMLIRFPPYGGGMGWFFQDFGRWDYALIDWPNAAYSIGSIIAFELTVTFLIKVYKAL